MRCLDCPNKEKPLRSSRPVAVHAALSWTLAIPGNVPGATAGTRGELNGRHLGELPTLILNLSSSAFSCFTYLVSIVDLFEKLVPLLQKL